MRYTRLKSVCFQRPSNRVFSEQFTFTHSILLFTQANHSDFFFFRENPQALQQKKKGNLDDLVARLTGVPCLPFFFFSS